MDATGKSLSLLLCSPHQVFIGIDGIPGTQRQHFHSHNIGLAVPVGCCSRSLRYGLVWECMNARLLDVAVNTDSSRMHEF